ncbi:sodium:proton antiporter [Candidatus Marinamargulisbacteria bacterium SCGC AG-343-D04]|nr:sodium:proton antiporter [Candidatus Marinamargulisbacteria bacterium SCGC AG-343-D04]
MFLKNISSKRLSIFVIFVFTLILSFWIGNTVTPEYRIEEISLDVHQKNGSLYYLYKDKETLVVSPVSYSESTLINAKKSNFSSIPETDEEVIITSINNIPYYSLIKLKKHWSIWSLIPPLITLLLCWITREPLTSLLAGILSGALIMRHYDIINDILIPNLMSKNAANMLLIYLVFLGGLLGIWSKTGAAQAFAEWMTRHCVKGPRSAKCVAWFLGILFFQGGTMSVVLVGTTVRPIADKENISHEELSYIVDSTASPIASQLAFNAWPGYVQAFIYVSGISWLATEADRITFFFKSVPFCFYAIFAVLGTFLVAIEKPLFFGKRLKKAMQRARKTGALDAPGAIPLSAVELSSTQVPKGYSAHIIEFLMPVILIIVIAIGTFITQGSPDITLAFGIALLSSFVMALSKGMSLAEIMDGSINGMKSLILGLMILLMAMTIGSITMQTGAGIYLTELLGNHIPYWILPVLLQILTMMMAFSTGTSWGTYAIVFPIAMPLAWSIAQFSGVAHPELFMTLCFAAVMDGSVYGDQCSPISDTTVLSAMCTGCDLMDHVKTQIPQATVAAILAGICWTIVTLLFV